MKRRLLPTTTLELPPLAGPTKPRHSVATNAATLPGLKRWSDGKAAPRALTGDEKKATCMQFAHELT